MTVICYIAAAVTILSTNGFGDLLKGSNTLIFFYRCAYISLASKLFLEGNIKNSSPNITISTIIFFIITVLYLYYHQYSPLSPHDLALDSGLLFLIIISPFLNYTDNSKFIWPFTYCIWKQALFSLIKCFTIVAGGGLIYLALKYLFSMNLSYIFAFKILIIVFHIYLPISVISEMPTEFNREVEVYEGEFLFGTIQFLAIPLFIISCTIIHFYFVKQIVSIKHLQLGSDLDQVIFYITLIFCFLSITIYLVSDRIPEPDSKLIIFFKNYFNLSIMGPAVFIIYSRYKSFSYNNLQHIGSLEFVFGVWLLLISFASSIINYRSLSKLLYTSLTLILLSYSLILSFKKWLN
jgi:hypothetical protein